MKNSKKQFNAIRNRKTGNIIVKHGINGKEIYFWVLRDEVSTIVVANSKGYLLRKADWDYMSQKARGIKTKFPVTPMILGSYRKALEAFQGKKTESQQIKKFHQRYGYGSRRAYKRPGLMAKRLQEAGLV